MILLNSFPDISSESSSWFLKAINKSEKSSATNCSSGFLGYWAFVINPHKFYLYRMENVTMKIGAQKIKILFEDLYNELVNEFNFLIALPTGDGFIMAYDFQKDRLAIQGAAPYFAFENEQEIAERIEQRYL